MNVLRRLQQRLEGIDVGDETARGREDTEAALAQLQERTEQLQRALRLLRAEARGKRNGKAG